MATVDKDHEAEPFPGNPYHEAEKLLKLAERLDEQCQSKERQVFLRLLLLITVLAAVASVIVVFLSLDSLDAKNKITFVVIALSYLGVLLVSLTYLTLRVRKEVSRDRRAMHQIVDMLREVERSIADRNEVSALERAEFRIRLSRFDIGPGYYPQRAW